MLCINVFWCISVLCVASRPRVKLIDGKISLHPTVVYTTDLSRAVVTVLLLIYIALWFILRGDLYCLALCYVLVFFSPFSIAICFRLGKKEREKKREREREKES